MNDWQEYDEDGNIVDPCESVYQVYSGDGMDVDMNCLEYLESRDCCYVFGNPNPVDEWCSFMCSVREPCRILNEVGEELEE